MDGVEATGEFQDWELLLSSPDFNLSPVGSPSSYISDQEIDSGGVLDANYFSLDDRNLSSSINLGLEENPTGHLTNDSIEVDLDGMDEMDFGESDQKEVISEVVEERVEPLGSLGKFCSDTGGCGNASGEFSDISGNSQVDFTGETEFIGEEMEEGGGKTVDDTGNKRTGELEKRSIVWWKAPMEFLKYYGFRMSPLWTVSVAAAVIGIAILSNKLYKMRKKATRGLGIKVAVDDKKVSQVMNHASRLNEAFSVVKRFPVIRPSLPAVGATTSWPVMNLR